MPNSGGDIAGGLIASETGGVPEVSLALNAGSMGRQDFETETLIPTRGGSFDDVAHTLRGEGFDAGDDGSGKGTPLVPVFVNAVAPTLNAGGNSSGGNRQPGMSVDTADSLIAISTKDYGADASGDIAPTLRAGTHSKSHQNGGVMPSVALAAAVRRLTPRECERLQGFPDDHTLIPWRGGTAPDGPRYKALGNSMAVPVMRWLGDRLHRFVFEAES